MFPALDTLAKLYVSRQLWRLLIDGDYQDSPYTWQIFEGEYYLTRDKMVILNPELDDCCDAIRLPGEPGNFLGMLRGLNYCLAHLGKPVSIAMLTELHEIVLSGVANTLYQSKPVDGFRMIGNESKYHLSACDKAGLQATLKIMLDYARHGLECGFHFRDKTATETLISVDNILDLYLQAYLGQTRYESLSDMEYEDLLRQDCEALANPDCKAATALRLEQLTIHCQSFVNDQTYFCTNNSVYLPAYMQTIIERYYDRSGSESRDVILRKIVAFNRGLGLLHPFRDGNGRIGLLILLKMLIEEGFPLPLLSNPNLIVRRSIAGFVALIEQGVGIMQNYLDNTGDRPFGTHEMDAEQTRYYDAAVTAAGLDASCRPLLNFAHAAISPTLSAEILRESKVEVYTPSALPWQKPPLRPGVENTFSR